MARDLATFEWNTALMNDAKTLAAPCPTILDNGSLFLDFDGTLVNLAATPDAVIVPEQVYSLISDLNVRLQGRLAIVSGRDVETLRSDFGLTGMSIAGSHGAQISINDGVIEAPARSAGLSDAFARLQSLAAAHDGVVIEDKPLGIGIHFRRVPEHEAACRAAAEDLVRQFDLSLQHGKMMFELRGEKADKGIAITRLMQHAPFKGRTPVFIGDDVTDENGFRAVRALGGIGIKIGNHGQTDAGYALNDVTAVHSFLDQFLKTEME